jgi:hypothetical protein
LEEERRTRTTQWNAAACEFASPYHSAEDDVNKPGGTESVAAKHNDDKTNEDAPGGRSSHQEE